jgi:O-antigen/teichoic acid export membrane protein
MNQPQASIVKGAIWTLGTYGVSQVLRLATNVVLTRLLAPELFGIMAFANSARMGIELLSDIGISQNIVYNKQGEEPDFYNTAWTLRLTRGVAIWALCAAAALPFAHFYDIPLLAQILPIYGLMSIIASLGSTAPYLLNRRLQFAKLNRYETASDFISFIVFVVLVYIFPTIWTLVFAGLVAATGKSVLSYFILPGIRHAIRFSREYTTQIIKFGKWIFFASAVYFLSMHFDRLYIGKVIPLELFGIYGIARNLSDLIGPAVVRLGTIVVFPLIASSAHIPRADLRKRLAVKRLSFLLIAAFGMSFLIATADLLIRILYDQRYHSAGWMLSILSVGAWFTIMCNLNESTLLGLGVPRYNAFANSLKLAWLILGLPFGFALYGIVGAIVVVATGDLFRYFAILVGQFRERFSFGMQDLLATVVTFCLVALWEWLRWRYGFGISFGNVSIAP